MPDLRNSPITGSDRTFGDNYRRASQKWSNFGTRRLRFYTIEVDGYDITQETFTEEWDQNFGTTGPNGDDSDYGYRNQPNSIIEAILRGVSLVAELQYVSWYQAEFDGPYPYLYITVAVSGDTFLDGQNQDIQTNNNAYSMYQAIGDALGNDFQWDDIYVNPVEIYGYELRTDNYGDALSREKVQMTEEQKAARQARISAPKVQHLSRNR